MPLNNHGNNMCKLTDVPSDQVKLSSVTVSWSPIHTHLLMYLKFSRQYKYKVRAHFLSQGSIVLENWFCVNPLDSVLDALSYLLDSAVFKGSANNNLKLVNKQVHQVDIMQINELVNKQTQSKAVLRGCHISLACARVKILYQSIE